MIKEIITSTDSNPLDTRKERYKYAEKIVIIKKSNDLASAKMVYLCIFK